MTLPSHICRYSSSNLRRKSSRLAGLALPSSFLHLFHVSPARCSTRRIVLRQTVVPNLSATHCRSFFNVQPRPGRLWPLGTDSRTVWMTCYESCDRKKGGGLPYGAKSKPQALVHCRCEPTAEWFRCLSLSDERLPYCRYSAKPSATQKQRQKRSLVLGWPDSVASRRRSYSVCPHFFRFTLTI